MFEKLTQICAGIAETQMLINESIRKGRDISNLENILSELNLIKKQILEQTRESIIQDLKVALS